MNKSDMTIVLLAIGTAMATIAAIVNFSIAYHSYLGNGMPYIS